MTHTSDIQSFGRYTKLRKLGEGGFATVYQATDTTLERDVALKILHQVLLADQTFVQRFKQEAKVIASLNHPHIVTIYDYGQESGRLFIAMTLGMVSLAEYIRTHGALSFAKTLELMGPICAALDYAHSQSLIHRDLKPANILLGENDHPILTDFGFARIAGQSSVSMSLSNQGIAGTPAYIPPEVWDQVSPSAQSDIYALGCIVYELLTGEVLFTGQTPIQAMRSHDKGPQFPPRWAPHTPHEIENILKKALAHEPSERYQSAGAFWNALKELQGSQQGATQPDAPPPAPSPTPPSEEPAAQPAAARPQPASPDPKPAKRRRGKPLLIGGSVVLVALIALVITAFMMNGGPDRDRIAPVSTAEPEAGSQGQAVRDAEELVDQGHTYRVAREYDEALDAYSRAIDIDPDSAAAYTGRGFVYADQNNYERAIEEYDRAIDIDPDFIRAYTGRGIAYTNLNNRDRADEDYNRAIAIEPENAIEYNARGLAYANLDQYEEAIEDYSQAIQQDFDPLSWPYYNRGLAYANLEQYEQAVDDYSRAIDLGFDPLNWPHYSRGIAYANLEQYEQAVDDYSRAIALDYDPLSWPYNSRGNAYFDLGEYEQAVDDYSRAIELGHDPLSWPYNGRGNAYLNLGQYRSALDDYEYALELDPDYTLAYYNMGLAYQELGGTPQAIDSFEEFLERSNDAELRADAEERLRALGAR